MSHLLPKLTQIPLLHKKLDITGYLWHVVVVNTKEVGISAHSFLQKKFQFGHPEGELKNSNTEKDISRMVPL